jgi:hypothetical protein
VRESRDAARAGACPAGSCSEVRFARSANAAIAPSRKKETTPFEGCFFL